MAHEVRLSDPRAVKKLLAALREARTDAVPNGGASIVVVDGDDGGAGAELRFFLRAWMLAHPGLEFELAESRGQPLRKLDAG
jgi:hypothetical protein